MSAARVLGLVLWSAAIAGAASAGEGFVALQSADASCPASDGSNYAPCGNGTVTDNDSGLVWLANASCFNQVTFEAAQRLVAGLSDLPEGACGAGVDPDDCDCGLSDGSSAGEWRLPTVSEWRAMIESGVTRGCEPTLENDLGTACWSESCYDVGLCSFYGVRALPYWSASPVVEAPANVWGVDLEDGGEAQGGPSSTLMIWPVRDGQ